MFISYDTIEQTMNTETCLRCSDSSLKNHFMSRIIRCPKYGHHHKPTNPVLFFAIIVIHVLFNKNSNDFVQWVQRKSQLIALGWQNVSDTTQWESTCKAPALLEKNLQGNTNYSSSAVRWTFRGLVRMIFWLVHNSYSLPKGQARPFFLTTL